MGEIKGGFFDTPRNIFGIFVFLFFILMIIGINSKNRMEAREKKAYVCNLIDLQNAENLEILSFDQGNGIDTTLNIDIVFHFILELGKESIDYDTLLLDTAINKLNRAFENTIKFNLHDKIYYHTSNMDLKELYTDYIKDSKRYDKLIKGNSLKGYYNIFILKDPLQDALGNTLMGFTPVFVTGFEDYIKISPHYDLVLLSYRGLFEYNDGAALIHETGHFLGLQHVFDMEHSDMIDMGFINEYEICVNYMNYNCFSSKFTKQQLEYMVLFARYYRNYLLK